MARTDRFLIAPINSGMQTNVKPFLIPDDAFEFLGNTYVFRGRVRKRFGSRFMQSITLPDNGYAQLQSRLRINLGNTNGSGALTGTVPGSVFAVGQMFSVADQIFTVYQIGTPAATKSTGAGSMTYNTSNGAFTITGAAPATAAYFFPATPVMGIIGYEQSNTPNDLTFAFDTQFAYTYSNTGWERLGTAIWTGTDTDFFWGYNWRGITDDQTFLFVTNYNAPDVIKYYNPDVAPNWLSLSPIVNNTNRLLTGKIVIPFKDRLLVLNTQERAEGVQFSGSNTDATTGNFDQTVSGSYSLGQQFIVGNTIFTIANASAGAHAMTVSSLPGVANPPTATFNTTSGELVITGNGNNLNLPVYYFDGSSGTVLTYVNRCRFSLNGDPTLTNGWIDQQPGLGGYIDAPTKESIVTAQFLRDRLIVYFEASTWELAYTGNQVLPFVWQQINTELGAESTFSQVPFDKVVLGIGNVGVHACNGANVERIDDKIPDTVFEIHNEDGGIERVYGIRDYYVEMVYWSFPDVTRDSSSPYNNRVLVYNYKNGSWAINDDSVTAFGYYQAPANTGETWQSDFGTWEEDSTTWDDGPDIQARFKSVLAGNQEGYLFIVDPDLSRNSPALQITNMVFDGSNFVTITAINHNLKPGFFGNRNNVAIENVQGVTGLSMIYAVLNIIDENNFTIHEPNFVGTYTGGGTIARVSNINIQSKQYNFYTQAGVNAAINKVDFLVTKTQNGQVLVDWGISSSVAVGVIGGQMTNSLIGNGVLETSPYPLIPFEQFQDRLWHPIYPMSNGECIQLFIYMDDDQMVNPAIVWSDFELHAMVFYATPTSRFE